MATNSDTGVLREGGGPRRATFLELFFDLVFVFALTRITDRLAEDFTSERRIVLTEVGQTTLLLLALYLTWVLAAWVTSRYDPERATVQLVIVAVMFGAMVMAVAVPTAFSARGPLFAGAYVAVAVGRPLLLMLALWGNKEQQRIPARIVCWSTASAVLWIAGAIAPEGIRGDLLWVAALALDYLGLILGWPTPGLGRARIRAWDIAGEHLAERYQTFVLIALGESILLIGLTYSSGDLGVGRSAGFVVAFATTVLLWRLYFFRAGHLLTRAVAETSRPAKLGQSAIYSHLVMVAGIIAAAVGYELVINHPVGRTDPAWLAVIVGGPALFLAGRIRFGYDVFGRVSPPRLIGLLVLAAVAPALVHVPPVAAAVTATLVLAGVAAVDAVLARGRPLRAPSPPP
jgi:low temperature requirement protein LtrA